MNPHVGQKFELRVIDKASQMETGRAMVDAIAGPEFSVSVPGLQVGRSYWVDFYADFSGNGLYDAPPTDHAWRLSLDDVQGDTTLTFGHNTDFTDVGWEYLFTLDLSGMNPHVGQLFELRVVDQSDGSEVGRTRLDSVVVPDFSVSVPGIRPGKVYQVDYYADFSKNGLYDAPPTDHAWRLTLEDVQGDTTLTFSHNTNFTDIQWPPATAVEERSGETDLPKEFALSQNYPNPFNPETEIRFDVAQPGPVRLEVFNSLGQRVRVLVNEIVTPGRYRALWDGRDDLGRALSSGVYFYRLEAMNFSRVQRMLLLK
jgi:hypothetical protein